MGLYLNVVLDIYGSRNVHMFMTPSYSSFHPPTLSTTSLENQLILCIYNEFEKKFSLFPKV